MPETFLVIEFICETDMLGSAGAVASMVAIPTKPLHCATPLGPMLGCAVDMPVGIGAAENGSPILQRTMGEVTVMGAMVNVPVAMN
jgi:hypothetical protein